MGQLYGCWLNEDFDYNVIADKIRNAHKEYYPFFVERVISIEAIAELFVQLYSDIYPNLKDKIFISYPSIISAVGRYVNDIMHYKIWHNVTLANNSKIVAHTIKWLSHYQVIVIKLSSDEYHNLTKEEKEAVLEVNTLFISSVIRYFLAHFFDGQIPSSKLYGKIFYLLETGQYDEKTAAVAFDWILI